MDSQIVIAKEYALQQVKKANEKHFDNKFQEIYKEGLRDGGKTEIAPRRELEKTWAQREQSPKKTDMTTLQLWPKI